MDDPLNTLLMGNAEFHAFADKCKQFRNGLGNLIYRSVIIINRWDGLDEETERNLYDAIGHAMDLRRRLEHWQVNVFHEVDELLVQFNEFVHRIENRLHN